MVSCNASLKCINLISFYCITSLMFIMRKSIKKKVRAYKNEDEFRVLYPSLESYLEMRRCKCGKHGIYGDVPYGFEYKGEKEGEVILSLPF